MVRIFRHYVPSSLLALGAAEVSILFGSMYLGVAAGLAAGLFGAKLGPGAAALVFPVLPKALIFAAVMLTILIAFGFYHRDTQWPDWQYWIRLAASFVAGAVVMSLIVPSLFLERGLFGLTVLFACVGTGTARYIFFKSTHHNPSNRRTLVLGTGSRAASLATLGQANRSDYRLTILGYIPLNGTQHAISDSQIVFDTGSILDIAQKHRANEIVVGVRDRRNGNLPIQDLLDCRMQGINVIDLPTFFERETGRVHLESLNPSWFVFSDGCRQDPFRKKVKRLFDISAASILLWLTLPIMALTTILIWLESGRPIFYRQKRIGEAGQPFEVLKFRSMCHGAEPDSRPQWSKEGDDRVTRVGKIMRKCRIDELPQLINVLKGDMSFVGPRPERPFFVDDLSTKIPYYTYRHTVKPGITGWAQIRYHYGASVEDAAKKLQYDLYYVKNQSLFLDLLILAQTAHIVLFAKGGR